VSENDQLSENNGDVLEALRVQDLENSQHIPAGNKVWLESVQSF
jgi:hypothetical protein